MAELGLDIALMVVLGYFFLRGLFRGVVKEVVAVLGLFVAFWVASVYWPLGDEHLRAIFDQPGQRGVTSFIIIFMVVYFLVSIISIFVDKIVRITITPLLSAFLGGLVGVLKGVLICGVFLAGVQTFLKPTEQFFTRSQLWPYLEPVAHQAKVWMPEALRAAMSMKRNLPVIGERDLNAILPGLPSLNLENVDWNTVRSLLATQPESITENWREKLENLLDSGDVTSDDLQKFITDHPNIFQQDSAELPSWPQPATD